MRCLIATMGVMTSLMGICILNFERLAGPLPLPTFHTNKYWGPGDVSNYKEDKTIKPFKIKIDPEVISDLQKQLLRPLKLTEPLEGVTFEYGYNTNALSQVVKYWRDNYLATWNERQALLNSLPQYTTEIQGLRIHFIHAKPSDKALKKKNVLPLLLLHGWPGSVREFYDIIPILTKPARKSEYVFEVIAPSLVGFGWSQPARKVGLNPAEMAIVMRNLMLRLGFNKFLVQGGDWGSVIGSSLSTIFPENVIGFHSNMCVLSTPLAIVKFIVSSSKPEKYLPAPFFSGHHFPLIDKIQWIMDQSGSIPIQDSKPDTIGTALSANPVGLAAYILEKFQTFTSPVYKHRFDGTVKIYNINAVIDNIMIYYLSNSATTAVRLYQESMSKTFLDYELQRVQSPVPMGCVRFRNDVPAAIDWQLLDKFPNLTHSTYYNESSHFAAFEVPFILYNDFAEFVAKIKFD